MDNTTQPSTPAQPQDVKKKEPLRISIKTAVIIAIIIVLVALAIFYRNAFTAAKVNGHSISKSEVRKELEKQSGATVLDALITKALIEDEAQKKNVTVTEADINAEIVKIEAQLAAQGGTLDQLLTQQNISREELKEQITTQVQVQKLLADKTAVTDAEVDTYLKDNKITLTKGKEVEERSQYKEQLSSQKLNMAASEWISNLRATATITKYVNY